MGHCPIRPLPPDPVQIAMNRPFAPVERRLGDSQPTTVKVQEYKTSDEGITPGTLIGAALVYQALDSVWGDSELENNQD